MTKPQRLADTDDLVERVRVTLRALAAVGVSAVGAGVLLLVSGATYYQSLLEGIHAHWAIESVGYTAMVFAGAHNLQLLLMTIAMTYAMVVGGILSWRALWCWIAINVLVLALCYVLPQVWPGLQTGQAAFWRSLTATVAAAYLIALIATALIARQTQSVAERRGMLMLAFFAVLVPTVFLPAHFGSIEAADILSGAERAKHPDVCLKGDMQHHWRLAHTLGDKFLLMDTERGTLRFRVAAQPDIESLLVSLPEQPQEGGPPSSPCQP